MMDPPPTDPPLPEPPGGAGPAGETDDARPGLPWEAERPGPGLVGALDTVRMVLFDPKNAFRAMSLDPGLGPPILFVLVLGIVGSFFGLLWQSAVRSMTSPLPGADFGDIALANVSGAVAFLLSPLIVLLATTVASIVYHGCLTLFGGATRPFEASLRVVCYSFGANWVWLLIPVCGGVFATLWGVVTTIIGLREVHRASTGRAAAAVLVPYLLAVCCCALFWITIVTASLGAAGLG